MRLPKRANLLQPRSSCVRCFQHPKPSICTALNPTIKEIYRCHTADLSPFIDMPGRLSTPTPTQAPSLASQPALPEQHSALFPSSSLLTRATHLVPTPPGRKTREALLVMPNSAPPAMTPVPSCPPPPPPSPAQQPAHTARCSPSPTPTPQTLCSLFHPPSAISQRPKVNKPRDFSRRC